MGESLQDRTIQNKKIRSSAPPRFHQKAVPLGFDHGNVSAPLIRARGRTLTSAPAIGRSMRGALEGKTVSCQAAGSDSELAGLPREHWAKEFLAEWTSALSQCETGFVCLLFAVIGRLAAYPVKFWEQMP